MKHLFVLLGLALGWSSAIIGAYYNPPTYTESATEVKFIYDGETGVGPPASFGMSSFVRDVSSAAVSWKHDMPDSIMSQFDFPPTEAEGYHVWHTGGNCGIGSNLNPPPLFPIKDKNKIPFGTPSKGAVAMLAWGHKGSQMKVELRTKKSDDSIRTFSVETQRQTGGCCWVSPHIYVDDGKVLIGYRVVNSANKDASVFYYKIYPLATNEWAVSFGGNVAETDPDNCGGGLHVMIQNFTRRSALRIGKPGGGFLDLAAQNKHVTQTSPLRITKDGTNVIGFYLVDTKHPQASPLRVQTATGPKAVRLYTP